MTGRYADGPVDVLVDGMDLRCAHGGRLVPLAPRGRVRSGGRLVLTGGAVYDVHDCPHSAESDAASSCSVLVWEPGEVRAVTCGRPLLLADARARTTPNGAGVVLPQGQSRVRSRRCGDDGHMEDIAIDAGGIRLGQLLKLAGLVDSGGEVRPLLAGGGVTVNGVVETRRGAQLRAADVVAVGEREIRLV